MESNAIFDALVVKLKLIPDPERRILAFALIRNIPYGNIGSRNPFDVLTANMGTCSGKHALLRLVLEALGYEMQSWFAKHNFGQFPVNPWPKELETFYGMAIPDYHDFLKVKVDGEWKTIDAIFDKPMADWGFVVQDWDGASNMTLPVQSTELFLADGPMEEHKKRLIGALSPEQQQLRKDFLEALTSWLNAKRKN